MQSKEIRIKVRPEIAEAYRKAPEEERRRIDDIVRFSVRMLTDEDAFDEATERLEQTVKEISKRASERGATQEIVDAIVDDE